MRELIPWTTYKNFEFTSVDVSEYNQGERCNDIPTKYKLSLSPIIEKFAKIDMEVLKPPIELIFNVADCCLRLKNSQAIAIGSTKNNQKNSGFKKVTLSIIRCYFLVLPN